MGQPSWRFFSSKCSPLLQQVFPEGATVELLDSFTDEMGLDAQLPRGRDRAFRTGRSGHGVDGCESAEAYQQFGDTTMRPALGKLAAQRGVDLPQVGEPEVTITEVRRVVP